MDLEFLKGMAAFLTMIVVFIGSVWLLLAMILGVRLGYFVMATSFFAVMILMSGIWLANGLGPKGADGFFGRLGEETAWQAVAASEELSAVETEFGAFDVADYPDGDWVAPSKTRALADVKVDGEESSTGKELETVKPVLDSLVLAAISPIRGKRDAVADHVEGDVKLVSGQFQTIEVLMREATVDGKPSIIAVGRAVPSDTLSAGNLGGADEAKVKRLVLKPGDQVSTGQVIAVIGVSGGLDQQITADKEGRLIAYGFAVGDTMKPGVNIATIDVSARPNAPSPVEVAAIRVRGSIRIPAAIYLVASVILFAVHMSGLRNSERASKGVTAPA